MEDMVSIEKVLNSRCSSELPSPKRSHFGTFVDRHPPEEVTNRVLQCCDIPRFTDGRLTHWFKNGYLFLGFENPKDPNTQRLLHVESGMQHEAVYLGCAAQGVGTCIDNEGIYGTQYEEKMATAKHLIMEITDPYETSKFSTRAPGPQKPFVPGKNLTEPRRDGDTECTEQLSKLATFSKSGHSATEKDVSQLLWAAKGRTPHCVKVNRWKFMWGITIPTWGGGQSYTTVYLVMKGKLYVYVNWTKEFSLINRLFREKLRWTRGNPTHDIRFARSLKVDSEVDGHEHAIFLCQNENTARALWESGYMLENMFFQARSLGISYESKIFSAEEISRLNENGIANAVAAVFI
jgi:hypothetical protein